MEGEIVVVVVPEGDPLTGTSDALSSFSSLLPLPLNPGLPTLSGLDLFVTGLLGLGL